MVVSISAESDHLSQKENALTDEIRIEDLLLRAIIGINGEERRDRQDVLINIVLFVDTRAAGRTDDIADIPVNYRTLTKRIISRVEESEFYLIERLAEEIACLCLEEPKVERVRVSVAKPWALRFAKSVGVVINRGRGNA
jgi:dihydroneopterin aldolase/D-erythro-7,8-dihydroneopterin triphosphate epimerase